MKCHVIELIKLNESAEYVSWLSELNQVGFFSKNEQQVSRRIFTEAESELAEDFFLETRCCKDFQLIQHSDGNNYCFFHLPTFAKDIEQFEISFKSKLAELEKQISSIPYFAESEQKLLSIKYAYDFRRVYFPIDLTFSDYVFKTPFYFHLANVSSMFSLRNCQFNNVADFSQAEFNFDFSIQNCQFSKAANFSKIIFNKALNLAETTFNASADFSKLLIQPETKFEEVGERIFENLTFKGYFDFQDTLCATPIRFSNIKFLDNANFSGVTFDKQTFENVTFEKEAIFNRTKFIGEADLNSFNFQGKVDCSNAEFERYYRRFDNLIFPGDVSFTGAKFSLGLILYQCTFAGKVNFDSAMFDLTTIFERSKFADRASFISTKFNWHTSFSESEFFQSTFFAADFALQADFEETIFHQQTIFGSDFYPNNFKGETLFNSTKFLGKTDFGCSNFNHPKIFFDNVDFSNVINLPEKFKIPRFIKIKVDLIIHNAKQLVTCVSNGKAKKGSEMQELGIIENGAVAIENGLIKAVGTSVEILEIYESENVIDAEQKVVMPAFVDPHTHIIYAGNRLNEFELKIKGADYLEILANGGGILSTVKHTREATKQELIAQTLKRLDKMLAHGTATVEIKTGYGLDEVTEFKMMDVWEELDAQHSIYTVPTFLAAHAIPPEFKNNPEGYVDLICNKMLPNLLDWRVNGYIDPDRFDYADKRDKPFFVDVFCEKNAFNLAETRRILTAAKENFFAIKAHVDEFTNLGGSRLAIELGATSIDHLDAISDAEIYLLANSKTVGIVTPTVNFNFGSTHFADARKLIDLGCAVAVSTDYNPGSAPCPSQQTAMQIACRYQKILPSEAISGTTINAAFSISLGDKTGSLEVGKWADILILDSDDYREICYEFGGNFVEKVFKGGKQS